LWDKKINSKSGIFDNFWILVLQFYKKVELPLSATDWKFIWKRIRCIKFERKREGNRTEKGKRRRKQAHLEYSKRLSALEWREKNGKYIKGTHAVTERLIQIFPVLMETFQGKLFVNVLWFNDVTRSHNYFYL